MTLVINYIITFSILLTNNVIWTVGASAKKTLTWVVLEGNDKIILCGLEVLFEISHVHYVRQAVGLAIAALSYKAKGMTYCWLESI